MDKFISGYTRIGNINFKLLPTGLIAHQPDIITQGHSHGNFELHVAMKDKFCMEIEDQTLTLHQNDSVLIFPNTFHRSFHAENNPSVLSFRFTAEKVSKSAEQDYYSKFKEYINRENGHALIQQNPLIAEYLRQIHTYVHFKTIFSEERIKALLVLLFSEMLLPIFSKDAFPDGVYQATSEYDSIINVIEHYFNDHYMEDISLSKLSVILCLSEKQTDHIIKKAFGIGFRECLSKNRLKRAKKLLRETEMEVKEVAEAVGYQSYNGFYLAFKSKFGIAPLEYREQK